MKSCLEYQEFDMRTISDIFTDFKGIKSINWPIAYKMFDNKKVLMVHSPVGTQAVFNDSIKYRIVISGFATSLEACSRYLKDMFITHKSEERFLELEHSFNSSALRTNINKICKEIGMFEILHINDNDYHDKRIKLLNRIKAEPCKYPILMTQALCCLGIDGSSNAKQIIDTILKYEELQEWAENSLNNWLKRITKSLNKDSMLILLGFGTSGKPAIKELVTKTYINDNQRVQFEKTNVMLIDFLMITFNGRVVFVPHPSQLTNSTIDSYKKSEEYRKANEFVRSIF